MGKPKLHTSFSVEKTSGAVYTGGQVDWVKDVVLTSQDGGVNIVKDGSVLSRLEEEEDPVVSFTSEEGQASENNVTVVTGHKSGLVRHWSLVDFSKPEVVRTFRSIHVGPISVMALHTLDGGGRVLATGGTDATVKVWDLDHQYYTHNFRTTSNVCTVITFHPKKLLIYGGFSGGGLFCWDLTNSKLAHTMEAHYSAVTGFQISSDGDQAVSCGRDKVVILWNLEDHSRVKTVPVFDSMEGIALVPGAKVGALLACGTRLRLWDIMAPKQLHEVDLGAEVTCLKSSSEGVVHAATADHNLITVSLPQLTITDTLVGNNDEILDLAYMGKDQSHLVVACNSPSLRLYRVSSWKCHLVPGHSDTVMTLAVAATDPAMVASGGKDKEIRVWRLEDDSLNCLIVASGHTASLGGLAFSKESTNFLVSVAKDTTIKMWSVDLEKKEMTSVRTEVAHEKDINCVDVAQGDSLIATGSQDRIVKLWTQDLRLVVAMRGHKRGIWCCKFSPVDRLLATGSADAVIRMWSLSDHTCVRQLEGHDSSVLRLDWIGGGELCSSSSDGLVKIWWLVRQECVATLDQHEDKVWALAVHSTDNSLHITAGSADGKIITWKDVTETAAAESQASEAKLVIQQQKLSNLLLSKQFGKALRLALRLSQPFTALKVIKKLDYLTLEDALLTLDNPSMDQLLGYVVKWNSNSRHSEAAQNVIHVILTNVDSEVLLSLPNSSSWLEGLLPYTEKHFARLSRLQVKTKFVSYLLHQMKETSQHLHLARDMIET